MRYGGAVVSDARWRQAGFRAYGGGKLGHQRGTVDGRPVVRIWSYRYQCWTYHVISDTERAVGMWFPDRPVGCGHE